MSLGLGVSAVASITYVGVWEANLAVTDHDFIDRYTSSLLAAREAGGMGAEDLRALSAEMEALKERYANPWVRMSMTFLGDLPGGTADLIHLCPRAP